MTSRLRSPRLSLLLLPLLALPVSAPAAPARKARPAVAAPRPVAANNAIIPVPLTPIVPASQRICAARTPTGLGYTILRAAPGPKPAADATALVGYIGYLAATGAVFDQAERSPLPVSEVIAGFSQGLQMVGKGGVIRLCVPAALGYGARESGPIPASSDLVFQVEMLDFRSAAEIEAMRKAQADDAPPPPEATPPAPATEAPK